MDPLEQLHVKTLYLEWRKAEQICSGNRLTFRAHPTAENAEREDGAAQHAFEAFVTLVRRIG